MCVLQACLHPALRFCDIPWTCWCESGRSTQLQRATSSSHPRPTLSPPPSSEPTTSGITWTIGCRSANRSSSSSSLSSALRLRLATSRHPLTWERGLLGRATVTHTTRTATSPPDFTPPRSRVSHRRSTGEIPIKASHPRTTAAGNLNRARRPRSTEENRLRTPTPRSPPLLSSRNRHLKSRPTRAKASLLSLIKLTLWPKRKKEVVAAEVARSNPRGSDSDSSDWVSRRTKCGSWPPSQPSSPRRSGLFVTRRCQPRPFPARWRWRLSAESTPTYQWRMWRGTRPWWRGWRKSVRRRTRWGRRPTTVRAAGEGGATGGRHTVSPALIANPGPLGGTRPRVQTGTSCSWKEITASSATRSSARPGRPCTRWSAGGAAAQRIWSTATPTLLNRPALLPPSGTCPGSWPRDGRRCPSPNRRAGRASPGCREVTVTIRTGSRVTRGPIKLKSDLGQWTTPSRACRWVRLKTSTPLWRSVVTTTLMMAPCEPHRSPPTTQGSCSLLLSSTLTLMCLIWGRGVWMSQGFGVQ